MIKVRKHSVQVSLTVVLEGQMMACAKTLGHDIRDNHQEGKVGTEKKEMTSEKQ